ACRHKPYHSKCSECCEAPDVNIICVSPVLPTFNKSGIIRCVGEGYLHADSQLQTSDSHSPTSDNSYGSGFCE
ncbi:17919_t:CDS:2, partial [Racocetra persica]